jgi:hypothetical protein
LVPELLGVPEGLAPLERVCEAERGGEAVALPVPLPVPLPVSLPVPLPVAEEAGVGEGVPLTDHVPQSELLWLGVPEALAPCEEDAKGVPAPLPVHVLLDVGVHVP